MTSTIKVNNIQNQCGANIINENSNTITIGASGDTIALASGASQTGFGREGSVDWQTSSIKTATFTATSGEGYFCNTSGGAFTVNLPAGSAGAIVAVADYTRSFATNGLTISPNGSEKIGGIASNLILDVNGQAATFVYVDATEGWINVQETQTSQTGNPFIVATGGTITTCGNDKIHTFTGPGTFTVSQASTNCAAENIVSYLIVGGGGGGGAGCTQASSGAGAGGFRELKSPTTPYTASPLDGYPSAPNRVTVTAQSYAIVVGGGGSGGQHGTPCAPGPGTQATQGVGSSFGGITGAGGAKGAHGGTCYGFTGGSGSGGNQGPFTGTGSYYNGPGCAGAGNTPPTTPSQGNPGGTGYTIYNTPTGNSNMQAGGGGGATAAGGDATPGSLPANTNTGGAGATTNITGSPVAYAGGGGGGTNRQGPTGPSNPTGGAAGAGGGGTGGQCGDGGGSAATAGGTNTGGGGGGTGNQPGASGGNGGSGIVVIRYKYK